MGEIISEIGDLVFSLVIGYMGALELLYVVRHLYHWSCGHAAGNENDANNLKQLQDRMRNQLTDAEAKEAHAGGNAMQDGVLYKDGFRIDPQQAEIDSLKEQQKLQQEKEAKRKKMEAELARQKQIEEETRKQLEKAEAELARQQKEAADAEENARKLLEAERAHEEEQRKLEAQREAEENTRKLLEAEREQEEAQRRKEEAAENERKLFETERLREEEQRQLEAAEQEAAEMSRKLLESEREREQHEAQNELEAQQSAEQSHALIDAQRERERKQKLIEENARKFLEAEQEMVELQQQMLQRQHSAPQTPVVEESCIKKTIGNNNASNERLTQTVKTQFGQTGNEPYALTTKPLLFPGVSDDGSSIEPNSSQQSSFSTQASEEITTGAEEAAKRIGMQFQQLERQEPDGEDYNPSLQYTDEYLRSLDGIKARPLVREDGSGRRRAFKKRRSSGSSNSSRESRASREEELKMFTSLEEEEMQQTERGESDYTPIKYSNEPTLKVKTHHRRHKRSPVKEFKSADNSLRGSLEMLGEEGSNPWGELTPEHYKDTEFWKREKAMSIDEEEIDFEKPAAKEGDEAEVEVNTPTNQPKTLSFEEANETQNQEAINTLQKQNSKKEQEEKDKEETKSDETQSDNKTNLQTSQNTEDHSSPARSSASPRLRRSPRIDEMDQYEERWIESTESKNTAKPATTATPTIAIHAADQAPWRDEYGLMMEGLSDFYDFTASVNPSRSRSTSRNPSPVNSKPSSPTPKNVSYTFTEENISIAMDADFVPPSDVDIYDDTDMLMNKHK